MGATPREHVLYPFEPQSAEVDDEHDLGNRDVVVDLSVVGSATIDCFDPKWSYWEDDADITVNDADWNEWHVWADAERRLSLQMTAPFDEEAEELVDSDVIHAEERDWRPGVSAASGHAHDVALATCEFDLPSRRRRAARARV